MARDLTERPDTACPNCGARDTDDRLLMSRTQQCVAMAQRSWPTGRVYYLDDETVHCRDCGWLGTLADCLRQPVPDDLSTKG